MTWQEVKKKAEELGVEDETEVLVNGYRIEAVLLETNGTEKDYFDLRGDYW